LFVRGGSTSVRRELLQNQAAMWKARGRGSQGEDSRENAKVEGD
jgi:hypothetical protein